MWGKMSMDRRRSLFLAAVLIGLAVCVVSVQAACEKGCDCLTPAEAKKLGYEYCGGTRTSCGTSLLEPKYCYGKPAEAIGCPSGSTSCGGSCVDTRTSSAHCGSCNYACPTGATCQGGTCVCNTGLTPCSLDPYSPVSKTSPKTFICANLQADESNCGVCGLVCGSGETCCDGNCVDRGTDEVNCGACGNTCPSGQSCTGGKCSPSATEAVQCPSGCGCMLPSEASAKDYTLCGGVRTVCGSQLVTGGSLASVKSDVLEKYCYLLRSPESCAASCSCMDPAKAAGQGFTSCGDEQVPCDADSQGRPYYCYKSAGGTLVSEKPVPCAKGCSCLDAWMINKTGYRYCGGTKTLCGYDAAKNPLYCFEKVVAKAPVQVSPAAPARETTLVPTIGRADEDAGFPAPQVRKAEPLGFFAGILEWLFGRRCPGGEARCNGVCVDIESNNDNCGACGESCGPAAICDQGECLECGTEVGDNTIVCDHQCVNRFWDTHCGNCETVCPEGYHCRYPGNCIDSEGCRLGTTRCGADCVDTQRSRDHCGACDSPCAPTEACMNGVCRVIEDAGGWCPVGDGRQVCGTDCVNSLTDPENCGRCGNVCTSGHVCEGGSCVCPAGMTGCRMNFPEGTASSGLPGVARAEMWWPTVCTDLQHDDNNCGECGVPCDSDEACVSGACVPVICRIDGGIVCDHQCIDSHVDSHHCGACEKECPAGWSCENGVCTSTSGCTLEKPMFCGYSCVDSLRDPNNCGGCDRVCGPSTTCVNGECVILGPQDSMWCRGEPGVLLCGGDCVYSLTDPENCGACGNACDPNEVCSQGTCVCPDNRTVCARIFPVGTSAPGLTGSKKEKMEVPGICTDLLSDEENCGECGTVCNSADYCNLGTCSPRQPGFPCGPGMYYCSGVCTDFMNDEENCGECEYRCGEGKTCCNGACLNTFTDPSHCGGCDWHFRCEVDMPYCMEGRCRNQRFCGESQTICDTTGGLYNPGTWKEECCDGQCVPRSEENCGGCGIRCAESETCCYGKCVDLSSDEKNCGACGNELPKGVLCCDGQYTSNNQHNCGECGNECPVNDLCCWPSGHVSNDPSDAFCTDIVPDTCGGCGFVCGRGETCCGSRCVDIQYNEENCGECGNECDRFELCQEGHCE